MLRRTGHDSTGHRVADARNAGLRRRARLGAVRPSGLDTLPVWLIGARDLQFRRRRVLIAVLATSVVFAMTLLMAGMSKGLDDEIDRVVGSFKADSWVVTRGASGPFTTTKFLERRRPWRLSAARRRRASRVADDRRDAARSARTP